MFAARFRHQAVSVEGREWAAANPVAYTVVLFVVGDAIEYFIIPIVQLFDCVAAAESGVACKTPDRAERRQGSLIIAAEHAAGRFFGNAADCGLQR